MNQLKRVVVLLMAGAMIFVAIYGCATRRTMVVLVPDRDGHVGEARVTTDGGHQVLDAAGQAAVVKNRLLRPEKRSVAGDANIETLFMEALAAEPPEPQKFYLYFKNGTTQLNGESLLLLSEILASIRKRQSRDISINGHTDRVGSDAFNQGLSLQRAQRIRSLLVKAGVNPAFLSTASHGEGNPLVHTPDNVAEPRNRRVEVIIR